MLSQYLQYLQYLDTPSLLAGQTRVLGISVFLPLGGSRSQVKHRDTGKQYLTCTLPYLIYDQQQLFRHENGVNATSS